MARALSTHLLFSLRMATLLLCLNLMTACHYAYPVSNPDETADSIAGIDSIGFLRTHHYWRGDIFRTSDSLRLYPLESPAMMTQPAGEADNLLTTSASEVDTIVVAADRQLFVTALLNLPDSTADSTWVYLTSTEGQNGWVKEGELLTRAAPDDPISYGIHTFAKWHRPLNVVGLIATLTVLLFFGYRRGRFEWVLQLQGSPYPILLRMCVSLCAWLYAMVWHFAPHTWTEYYFNPTLNPFATELPLVLAVFLAASWLLALLTIAVVDDVWRRLPEMEALAFLLELMARCGIVSLVFSLSTNYIYLGGALMVGYWAMLLNAWWRANVGRHYHCGQCGRAIREVPGTCPYCGAENTLGEEAASQAEKSEDQHSSSTKGK